MKNMKSFHHANLPFLPKYIAVKNYFRTMRIYYNKDL